jgi:hypothetical protein
LWKNIVERARRQMNIWPMFIECWIRKATNIHPLLVILVFHYKTHLNITLYVNCLSYYYVYIQNIRLGIPVTSTVVRSGTIVVVVVVLIVVILLVVVVVVVEIIVVVMDVF